MTESIVPLITQYGYLALFIFLFIQEMGTPSPIPNEVVLLISGYLVYSGILTFFGVLMVIILSDVLAALIIYVLFYFFGSWLINSKPKWLPIPTQAILKLKEKVALQGNKIVFMGRLTPVIRGYVAIISGLTRINLKKFIFILLFTATIWGLFFLILGYIISPYWQFVEPYFYKLKYVFMIVAFLIVFFWLAKKIQFRRIFANQKFQ